MVRYSFSLLWVSAPVKLRKGREERANVCGGKESEKERKEGGSEIRLSSGGGGSNDTNSGDKARGDRRRDNHEC